MQTGTGAPSSTNKGLTIGLSIGSLLLLVIMAAIVVITRACHLRRKEFEDALGKSSEENVARASVRASGNLGQEY